MFDYLISFLLFRTNRQKDIKHTISYKVLELGPKNTKDISLIFTHWHSTEAAAKRIYRKLGSGKRALVVKMNNALSDNPDYVIQEHLKLRESVEAVISKHNLNVERIIGVSIGNIHVGYFADKYNPKYVDMVAPGNSLAGCLWSGFRTQTYKSVYSKLGIDLEALESKWQELSYDKYHRFLSREDCSVRIWASDADKLIRPSEFNKLKPLIPDKPAISIKKNRFLGHYLTLLRVWCFWRDNRS